jgi:Tfp pilus assembly protein PilZ
MSRRRSARRPRRVQVTFWKRGEEHGYPGYTTNISTTGMFIGTGSPFPPGTRLRIEVLDREHGFMVEGMVAHARRIRGELARLAQSGMGVRFLSVEELVRELIPAAGRPELEAIPETAGSEAADGGPAPSAPAPALADLPTVATPPASPDGPARGSEAVWNVHFANPRQFVQVFDRDLVHGGLFVATQTPARVSETVTVEVHLPLAAAAPVRLRARVVQRFEPKAGAGGPNLLAGMGVELLDPQAAAAALRPVADRLREP